MQVIWYGLTVFFSSAILLVLEIVAGRLIAPYVGVSLYSWTSIIGVILAGLSLGNWLGGRWADRGGSETSVGIALAAAGVFCIASLFSLSLITPYLQSIRLNLVSSSFLHVLAIFFIPAVLLGIVSPLLTTLALKVDGRAGHIVGRMHALAALGSIVGTFLTGYWLVQFFGTRSVVVGCAICLFILAIPYLRGAPRLVPASLLAAIATVSALTHARDGFRSPCDRESSYYCLSVIDASMQPIGEARALIIDHLLHSMNAANPSLLVSSYAHLMDELVLNHFGPVDKQSLRYFFAGGGGYAYPRAVTSVTPDAEVTVAEIDAAVTEVAQKSMFLDTADMQIIHIDARVVLQGIENEKFDVVVMDVFHDLSVPYHLITGEFAELVKAHLASNGLYLINIVDTFQDPQLLKSFFKTMKQTFSSVEIWRPRLVGSGAKHVTYVVCAGNRTPKEDRLQAQQGLPRSWIRVTEQVELNGTPLDKLSVLTDDFVPVERLLSPLLLTGLGM